MASQAKLFQYGSNMSSARLQEQVRRFARVYAPPAVPLDVRFLGKAALRGWRFVADLYSAGNECRVCNVIPQEGSTVWGALYELDVELVLRTDGTRSVLDRIEGHRTTSDPENYTPIEVLVVADGSEFAAWTYIGLDEARARCAEGFSDAPVSDNYRSAVLDGAAAVELPPAYVAHLAEALGAGGGSPHPAI
jgi:gamma-glutamylcyclotransferase (GGCT)/AIG2-like uncharacterized protein YtfP